MAATNYDEEFDLIGQAPRIAPSAFDDFWGVITDMAHIVGEDDKSHEFYRQVEFTLRLDEPIGAVEDTPERFTMPTDRKTGGVPLGDNGQPVLPTETSKWGRFYTVLDTLGVPWEHKPSRLIGLHAHFQSKGVRRTREEIEKEQKDRAEGKPTPRRDRNELPYGRYVVEWDSYDNALRQSRGLSPINDVAVSPALTVSETGNVSDSGLVAQPLADNSPEIEAALLADGKDFMRFLGVVRTSHQQLKAFGSKGALDKLVDDGLLVKSAVDGKEIYSLGPKFH